MVSFDGKSFHLHCEGAGVVTIVLEAGKRGAAWVWSDELPSIAKYTRVCAFDQLGGGYSGPEPKARSDAEIAADTWTLLKTAGEHGPFVVVGYGSGAEHARTFASQHPETTIVTLGRGFPSRDAVDRTKDAISEADRTAYFRSGITTSATPPPAPMTGDDGLVEVGDRMMHAHCKGQGSPVVVFDAGRGGGGWHFTETQEAVARETRACVYDRLGNGLSGQPLAGGHTSAMMVTELRGLLAAIHAAPPYVLVGHSFGGMNVQLFASEHRDEVAGLVLVDPMSEKLTVEGNLDDGSGDGDLTATRTSCAQMAAARKPFGDLPLVLVRHGLPLADARVEREWTAAITDVAASSTNSAFVIAENTGHMIPYDQPALVTAAVREVLNAARSHSRVDSARVHQANGPVHAPPDW